MMTEEEIKLIVELVKHDYQEFARAAGWPELRDRWLKDHPHCAYCGRGTRLAVHHKYPVSWPRGTELELSENNLITLCEWPTMNCHLWIGHLGDWSSRNPTVETDAAEFLVRIKGRTYPTQESPP